MTLTRFWAFLAVALPVLAALIANLSSVDLTYHLRAGDEILANGALPGTDTWTYTAAGAEWVDQQWGAQVVLFGVYRLAGWTGLVILRALLVGVIFGCVFEIGRRRGLGTRRAAGLTFAAFVVAAVALALRPQLFGMALFAVVVLLVVDRRANPDRLWIIPVLVAIWANLHGSFFLGPLVLGLAWLEDLHDRAPGGRRVLLVAIVSAGRRLPDAVRADGLGLCRRPVDQRRGDRADQRVAAHLAPQRAGPPLLRVGRRGRGPHRPPRCSHQLADARLARGRSRRSARTRSAGSRGGRWGPSRRSPARC